MSKGHTCPFVEQKHQWRQGGYLPSEMFKRIYGDIEQVSMCCYISYGIEHSSYLRGKKTPPDNELYRLKLKSPFPENRDTQEKGLRNTVKPQRVPNSTQYPSWSGLSSDHIDQTRLKTKPLQMKMNRDVTPTTYIRRLDLSTLRRLADFLDPDDRWRDVVGLHPEAQRGAQVHAAARQGRAPTIELLTNWGTTNATVGELGVCSCQAVADVSITIIIILSSSSISEQQQHHQHHPNVTGGWVHITGNFDDRPTSRGRGNRSGKEASERWYKGFVDPQTRSPFETSKLGGHGRLFLRRRLPCLVYVYMANGSVLDRLACMVKSRGAWLLLTCSPRGKRGNILLDENFVAKISDFGLTRASATRSSATVLTERIVGTRAYMAPEALRGEITPKSDVFSFGVVGASGL
ncbi:Interleukin-1 receptor-associated kinase 4 [Merluccius polli]|uniref:Interleukin-1 receptor-associated kinase 4 n=1 Tax=Merluccius polli TaxID=89951 RepID=A0AA47MBY2_MERPO|nr:Interleukin-1 receptor-associated kinase 4 [Merluccius polli]